MQNIPEILSLIGSVVVVLAMLEFFSGSLSGIVKAWIAGRQAIQMKELEVRQIEAQARLAESNVIQLLPEYVDPDDKEEVRAYLEARRETIDTVTKGREK